MGNELSWFPELAKQLSGQVLSHVWMGHGSALFLEFGVLARVRGRGRVLREPRGAMTLMIQWSWRIENSTSVICGSWSEPEHLERFLPELIDRRVGGIELFGRLPEVDLHLSGDLHVLSFMTESGDPEWTLFDRQESGTRWVRVRDGKILNELSC